MARKSNPNNYKYYSEKYLLSMVGTKSLKKLKELANHEVYKYSISAYLYYNKMDKLSEYLHEELYNLAKEFERLHNSDEKEDGDIKNRYKEVDAWIGHISSWTDNDEKYKYNYITRIVEIIDEHEIPVKHIADQFDINYQVLYRVLRHKEHQKISKERLMEIFKGVVKKYGNTSHEGKTN